MKASVAPISRATSISLACARTCRRMVLKVTATSAPASRPASRAIESLPMRRKASKRLTQSVSSWTWATCGQPEKVLAEPLQRFRLRVFRLDDEGVRQRVFRQAGDDFGHAFGRLQALQCFIPGYKAPVAGSGFAQSRFDFFDFLLAGVKCHENTDLLNTGGAAGDVAQVVENHPAGTWQRQRDADDQQRQEGVSGEASSRRRASRSAARCWAKKRLDADPRSRGRPRSSRDSRREARLPQRVVRGDDESDADLMEGAKDFQDGVRRFGVEIGLSARRPGGWRDGLTTARAIARRCCSPPEGAIGCAFSR